VQTTHFSAELSGMYLKLVNNYRDTFRSMLWKVSFPGLYCSTPPTGWGFRKTLRSIIVCPFALFFNMDPSTEARVFMKTIKYTLKKGLKKENL
jgi:hypothetical protein